MKECMKSINKTDFDSFGVKSNNIRSVNLDTRSLILLSLFDLFGEFFSDLHFLSFMGLCSTLSFYLLNTPKVSNTCISRKLTDSFDHSQKKEKKCVIAITISFSQLYNTLGSLLGISYWTQVFIFWVTYLHFLDHSMKTHLRLHLYQLFH